jgi:hypothetical protein
VEATFELYPKGSKGLDTEKISPLPGYTIEPGDPVDSQGWPLGTVTDEVGFYAIENPWSGGSKAKPIAKEFAYAVFWIEHCPPNHIEEADSPAKGSDRRSPYKRNYGNIDVIPSP